MVRVYDPELWELEEELGGLEYPDTCSCSHCRQEELGGLESELWAEQEADLIEGRPRIKPIRRRRRRAVEVLHPGIPGADNRWFPTQREAHLAAWRRASELGSDYGVVHDSHPRLGWPHYYVVYLPAGRRVSGHFFYGGRPPRQMFRGRPWREFEVTPAPPIFTPRDVIDPRIDVGAQKALLRMFKGDPGARADAMEILAAVKGGQLAGIYGDDLLAAVKVARKLNTQRWLLVLKGEDATLVLDPADPLTVPPTIIFRGDTPDIRAFPNRLDPALRKAYATYRMLRTGKLTQCAVKIPNGTVVAESSPPIMRIALRNLVPPLFCYQPQASDPGEVQRRCRPLGCPLFVTCDDGEQMFLTDCGRGPCPFCPPGFDELLVKAWCVYTGITPGRWGLILVLPFGAKVGPICF